MLTFDPIFAKTLAQRSQLTVLALPPDLQFGDLSRLDQPQLDFYQLKVAHLGLGQWAPEVDAQTLQTQDRTAINALQTAIEANTPLCVWWTEVPNDIVGLWWLADRCAQHDRLLSQVHVPTVLPHRTSPKLTQISHLADLTPDEIAPLANTATTLSKQTVKNLALGWQDLVQAPGDLRVWLNGQLLAMPQSFYDPLILAQTNSLPTTKLKRLDVIGNLIGRFDIDVPDWWWYARLRHLFE